MIDNKDPKIIAEINEFFERFIKTYPKTDVNEYLSLFSKDANLVMFGTGNKWVGYEEYKTAPQEDKDNYEDISIKFDWKKINYHGKIAWIAAEVTVTLKPDGQKVSIPGRLTGVLKKTGDGWLIVQGHISVPPSED